MLQLLDHDKAFIPAKRVHDRKPLSKVVYVENRVVHVMTICNN